MFGFESGLRGTTRWRCGRCERCRQQDELVLDEVDMWKSCINKVKMVYDNDPDGLPTSESSI